jgi:hypothetical protein
MIVLRPWAMPETWERQLAMMESQGAQDEACRRAGLGSHTPCCSEPTDYAGHLADLWGREDFIVIEHDIAPGPEDLNDFLACPEPLCAFPYRSTDPFGRRHWSCSHSGGQIKEGAEWAIVSGLGLTKFTTAVTSRQPLPHDFREKNWGHLDSVISQRLEEAWRRCRLGGSGGTFHLHWPEVQHFH